MKWLWYFILSFCALRLFYFAEEYIQAHVLYSLGALCLILFWMIAYFRTTPYHKIIDKIILFNIIIYQVHVVGFFCFAQYNRLSQYTQIQLINHWGETISITASSGINNFMFYSELMFIPIILILNHLFLQKILKTVTLKSDKLNDEYIYLGVLRPKNYVSIVSAFLKLTPISGFFLYANNSVYTFQKNCSKVQKVSPIKLFEARYSLINTGIKIKDKNIVLENLIGIKWSLKNNCITVFSRVLDRNVFDIVRWRLANGKG